MKDKLVSLPEAAAKVKSGMTIGIGGWASRRKPMRLIHEICKGPAMDLTVVSYGGPDVGMLCAAGKVRRLIFGFVSLDHIPLDPHFRRARENGDIEAFEIDEGMLQWGLLAASARLPFLPVRAGIASDVQRLNKELKLITSPYEDRETLIAMPALNLDLALIHANRADRHGNTAFTGPDPFFDDLFCDAARKSIVVAEKVVEGADLLGNDCVHCLALNRSQVSYVAEAPAGAAPTSCEPDYGVDLDLLRTYASDPMGALA